MLSYSVFYAELRLTIFNFIFPGYEIDFRTRFLYHVLIHQVTKSLALDPDI